MTQPDLNDTELDALFAATRRTVAEPGEDFLKSLEAQAVEALKPVPVERDRFSLAGLLGGWRGMGGLAAAAITGLWIGIAPPDGVPDPLDLFDQALNGAQTAYDPVFGGAGLDQLLEEDGDNV